MPHWSQQTLLTCSQMGHITSAHMRIKGSHIALPTFKMAEIVIHYLSQEEQKWNIHEQPQCRVKNVKLGFELSRLSPECVLLIITPTSQSCWLIL